MAVRTRSGRRGRGDGQGEDRALSEGRGHVRDAAVSSTDVLQFVTVNAQTEPAFATRVTQIGSRGDLGWANSSLPLLYFTKTRTDLTCVPRRSTTRRVIV